MTRNAPGSVTVELTGTHDEVTVEFSRTDESTGRRWVYIVRQYSRRDPALRAELSHLQPVSWSARPRRTT